MKKMLLTSVMAASVLLSVSIAHAGSIPEARNLRTESVHSMINHLPPLEFTNEQLDRLLKRMDEEKVFHLPGEKWMCFDSTVDQMETKWGCDFFTWKIAPIGRGYLVWFIRSEYPMTNTGPNRDVMSTGLALRFDGFKCTGG